MSRHQKQQLDTSLIAVLHQAGADRGWLAMLCRQSPPRADGPRVELVEEREFAADDDSIESWLDEHSVGRVLSVLPSARVICRICPLPDASQEQLLPALRLQAEAHLLGGVPAHRVTMAVLPAAPGESTRHGLILAWPDTVIPSMPLLGSAAERTTCVPEIGALAAIVGGQRPEEPVLWVDREEGSLALALSHPGGLALRATREDTSTAEQWREGVSRTVAETALSTDLPPSYVTATLPDLEAAVAAVGRCGLVMPSALIGPAAARLHGAPQDPAWWTRHGVAVGAVIAATGPLRALTELRADAAREQYGPIARVARALSSPRAATIAVIVAIAALLFGPALFARVRLAVLEAKLPDLESYQAEIRESERLLTMYRDLQKQTWPLSKLLGDLANTTPEGIELDSINVNMGEGVNVRGVAKPHDSAKGTDAILDMVSRMNDTRIFSRATPRWDPADAKGMHAFTLLASIDRPYLEVDYAPEDDFAIDTLADRRYGKQTTAGDGDADSDATAPAETVASGGDDAAIDGAPDAAVADSRPVSNRSTGGGPRRNPRGSRPSSSGSPGTVDAGGGSAVGGGAVGDGRGLGRRGSGDTGPSGPSSRGAELPEPLSPEEIKSMSRAEAQEALSRVAKARQQPGLEEADSERLKNEFNQLLEQMKNSR